MASRGSRLSRAVQFFREGDLDEARVAFQLVEEIMTARLSDAKQARRARTHRTRRNSPERREVPGREEPSQKSVATNA